MENRANYALVGAFTLLVIAAAFSFVFWFSGASKTNDRKSYEIIFNGSVAGLSRGSAVQFNGLGVGEVTQIDFLENDPSRVFAIIDINGRTPIKTDTKARLEFSGLTGVATIALTGGSATAQSLRASTKQSIPLIYADRSEIQNLLESVQNISTKADSIFTQLSTMMNDNGASITKTIHNVESVSDALASNPKGLQDLMQSLGDIGTTLKPLSAKLEVLSGDVDVLLKAVKPASVTSITDDMAALTTTLRNNRANIDTILAKTASITTQLDETAGRLDPVLKSLNGFLGTADGQGAFAEIAQTARSYRQLAEDLNGRLKEITANIARFSYSGLREYEGLAIDSRRTINDIDQAVRNFDNNPQSLIFGKPGSSSSRPTK